MGTELQDKRVIVIGRGSGIARGIVLAARAAGAQVVAAGRDADRIREAYADDPGVSVETVDLTDDDSIMAFAERVGAVDHIVSTASARARGTVDALTREAALTSFDVKVLGPLMLARAFRHQIKPGGSLLLFSGAFAFKIEVGTLGVAITNGAADTLARSLALGLAPIRVNALSPGVIDTGAWDGLGEERKAALFERMSSQNPARRIGYVDDIAHAAMELLTNGFITGVTLHVDGGERLI